jgi:branched-chain amino acid transport system substrate-binding protein
LYVRPAASIYRYPAGVLPRLRPALAALLLLLVVLAGCAGRPADEVDVGAYLSLTGVDSSFGVDTKNGIDLAADELNARGGVHGKRVKVLYEDDRSLPNEATLKALELVDREGVVALLGEVASSRTKAGGYVAEQRRVPMITPSSTRVDLTAGRTYVFRTCFTDAQEGNVAARFVRESLGKKRVAVLYSAQDPYSVGLAGVFRSDFRAAGGEIVADKGFQKGETKFTTYLQQIVAAEPEAIYVPVYYNEMALIARDAGALGVPGSMFVGGDAWDSYDLLEGAAAELDGAYFADLYAPDVPWESSRAFVAAYRARFGAAPSAIAAQGYDAAAVLFDAMARAPDLSREAVTRAIGETTAFAGATGSITIGPSHDADKPVVIVQVKDGAFRFFSQMNAVANAPAPAVAPAPPPSHVGAREALGALGTGVAQGAMIALVALGYTMVFGVLGMINFAHSEVFMMAAYAGLFVVTALLGVFPPALAAAGALVVAAVFAAGLGVAVERVAYRPIRARARRGRLGRIAPLVTAIAVSMLLQNVAQALFTARYRSYPHVGFDVRPLIVVAAAVAMLALEGIVRFTWFGKAMRALSTNEEAARLMGIRTSRTIAATFALGSALAAVGALLYCVSQSEVYPTMGVRIGTQAFVAAVIGGIGRVSGAVLGGLLIGIVGELVKLTDWSGGVDVLVFAALIVVLLVRPTGLLGTTAQEKV